MKEKTAKNARTVAVVVAVDEERVEDLVVIGLAAPVGACEHTTGRRTVNKQARPAAHAKHGREPTQPRHTARHGAGANSETTLRSNKRQMRRAKKQNTHAARKR